MTQPSILKKSIIEKDHVMCIPGGRTAALGEAEYLALPHTSLAL